MKPPSEEVETPGAKSAIRARIPAPRKKKAEPFELRCRDATGDEGATLDEVAITGDAPDETKADAATLAAREPHVLQKF